MRKELLVLILYLFVGAALAARACEETQVESQPGDSSHEERMKRVENGLIEFTETVQAQSGEQYSINERMSHYRIPGVGIAVIEDYEIDWAKGYGVRVAGGKDPVTTDTLFNAGSISKMFSAAGALKFVEAGILDLDQDVNEVLVS